MRLNFFFNPVGIEGYSTHGIEMLRAMCAGGWDVACIPDLMMMNEFSPDPLVREAIERSFGSRGKCPGIKLNLPLPFRVATFSGTPRIFYTVTETDRLFPEWVDALNTVDEVWTASEWGREVFERSGVTRPIRLVPEGIDPLVFRPPDVQQSKRETYRFLSVGKLEERKNFAGLFRAFCEEFEPDEPVELMVHFGLPANPYQFLFNLNLGLRHPQITFSQTVSTSEEMGKLYTQADAFVLPTRGEGWGLPVMEAMACGLPVIVTGIGPIREYTTEQTALLIDYELVPARDPVYINNFGCGYWAEPDVNQLRGLMRRLYERQSEGKDIGRRAAAEIHSHWTWGHAVQKASNALQEAGIA